MIHITKEGCKVAPTQKVSQVLNCTFAVIAMRNCDIYYDDEFLYKEETMNHGLIYSEKIGEEPFEKAIYYFMHGEPQEDSFVLLGDVCITGSVDEEGNNTVLNDARWASTATHYMRFVIEGDTVTFYPIEL